MRKCRPYQQKIIDEIHSVFKSGKRAPLVQLVPGGGKTFIATCIAEHEAKQGGRVLFIAPRDELVRQAHATMLEQALRAGCILADGTLADVGAPIQLATIQCLLARNLRPEASLVISDEHRHQSINGEWARVVDSYPHSRVLALDGTPERADGSAIAGCDSLIVGPSPKELIDAGVLVPCTIIRPRRSLGSKKIAQRPVDAWLQHAKGRPTFCFAANTPAAEEYLREFQKAGIKSAFVGYKTKDRAELLARFKRGDLQVLISIGVLTEGIDFPPLSCIILARTCGSASLYLQITARGLRSSLGKQDCLLLDLAGQSWIHGSPDEEREYSLDGRGISRKNQPLQYHFCRVCSAPIGPQDQVCGECGIARELAIPPKVTGDALARFSYIRKRGAEERQAHYFKMLDECKAKGHAIGRAFYRFKGAYGDLPPYEWTQQWKKKQ